MAHFSLQAKLLSHSYKSESMDNGTLLSDTSPTEVEHLVGMGDGTVDSSLSDLPLEVRNGYLTCRSQGKGNGAPSTLCSTMPKYGLHAESKGWGGNGALAAQSLGQQKVAGDRVRNAAALLLPVGQTSDYERGGEREPCLLDCSDTERSSHTV